MRPLRQILSSHQRALRPALSRHEGVQPVGSIEASTSQWMALPGRARVGRPEARAARREAEAAISARFRHDWVEPVSSREAPSHQGPGLRGSPIGRALI